MKQITPFHTNHNPLIITTFFWRRHLRPYKKFLPQNKKRTKTTRDTMYSAMSSIPSGGPPGGTHTQELWYSLRGIDARLESVLSTYKCLCDACCARSQPLILLFLFSYFGLKNFLYGQAPFCTDVISVFAKILS